MGTYGRKKHPRCSKCIYRSSTDDKHSCDFAHFIGTTRTRLLGTGDELKPENCALFKEGKRIRQVLPALPRPAKTREKNGAYYRTISAIAMFKEGATVKEVQDAFGLTLHEAQCIKKFAKRGKTI